MLILMASICANSRTFRFCLADLSVPALFAFIICLYACVLIYMFPGHQSCSDFAG